MLIDTLILSVANFNMNIMSTIGCFSFFLCVGNFAFSESINYKLKVTQMEHWVNYVQFSGNIGLTVVRSVVECMAQCNNNKQCLSFFYNQKLRKCVLHRKYFYKSFSKPEIYEEGWKYYSAKYDGTKKCSDGYTLCRELDYCYRIFRSAKDIGGAKSYCNSVGGQLSAINSPDKQDFLEHVMVGRPHDPVLIDGGKQPDDTWRQEKGSLLTYSNWYPNEPNGDGNCIQLCTGDKWCDVHCKFVQDVLYMCEE